MPPGPELVLLCEGPWSSVSFAATASQRPTHALAQANGGGAVRSPRLCSPPLVGAARGCEHGERARPQPR
eukprot:364766-Chlamydomonas_euryale.AAC.1